MAVIRDTEEDLGLLQGKIQFFNTMYNKDSQNPVVLNTEQYFVNKFYSCIIPTNNKNQTLNK